MRRPTLSHLVPTLLFGALALVASCNGRREITGTETHWLQSCSADSDCGDLQCHCQICTLPCTEDADCSSVGGACGRTDEPRVEEQCGGSSAPELAGLCMEPMGSVMGSEGGSGDGGTTTGSANAGAGGSSSTGSSGNPAGGADVGSSAGGSPSSSGATNGGSANGGTASGGGGTGGGNTSGAGGQSSNACAELDRANLAGCCYDDTDCEDGSTCYGANCSADTPVPGRCEAAPESGCYDDRDCDEAESCDGGSLAACGSLAADSLGTCMPDCELDSCHPERCDESGEPCCDPLPGDGPNYCNGGLECVGAVCASSGASMEEISCVTTGGTWDPGSCGHYSCGRPPSCEALIPGCNCGIDGTFGESGCAVDASCDAATMAFDCGTTSCDSVGTQYCDEADSGPAGTLVRSCADIPSSCFADGEPCTCTRLLQAVEGTSCRTGGEGQLVVTRPVP